MLKTTLFGAAVSVAAISLATSALAVDLDGPVTVPGAMLDLWLGANYINAPVANGLGTAGDENSFLFLQQTDNGASLEDMGWGAGLDVWAPAQAMTLYAELDGQFVSVDKQDTVTIDSDGTFTDVLPINGGSSAGVFTSNSANANAGDIATSDISIDYSRITGALGLGGAGNGPVQLAYGVLASKSNLELVSSVSLDSQPGTADLDETVDGWSAGPMLALSTSKPLSDKLMGTLKGRVALLYASVNLDAQQTASNHLGGGLEVTDDANALAGLAEFDLGLSLAASDKLSFSLSIGGGVRNDYFSIVNPRSAGGEDANNTGDGTAYNPGPASLEQATMWNANVKAGITGKF